MDRFFAPYCRPPGRVPHDEGTIPSGAGGFPDDEGEHSVSKLKALLESLTPREQEVIAYVTARLMSKQIAGKLGVSEITVKVHRGNVMRKMGAKSLADLVRMADTLAIRRAKTQHL
jgi:DNA-binding NarL/FixJ family response regulator